MKMMLVKWRDSRMYLRQAEKHDDFECCEIESIGFLLDEDDGKIVLVGDLIDDDVRRAIVIPKESVLSRKVLR